MKNKPRLLRKIVGIDVSMDTFTACFASLDLEMKPNFSKVFEFSNDLKGFRSLLRAMEKIDVFRCSEQEENVPRVCFVLEATGVYYENLAYFLQESGLDVSVVVPHKTKNHAKTLNQKSKTDKLDAIKLATYGLEKELALWDVPYKIMKELKTLTREYSTLKKMKSEIKNRIHAQKHSHKPLEEIIKLYDKQMKVVLQQIKDLVKTDEELSRKIKKIITINGVGFITLVTVISETNGFSTIKNSKQLASYAGYDVVYNDSGKKKGKQSISHKGNSHLRAAVYMPAVSAIQCNKPLREFYQRLLAKNKLKMVALIAVARKLLLLIYTLWKKDEEYNPAYNIA
jgi:transposase